MKFDPGIPIGKAMDNEHGDEDTEVTGHGLIIDTGDPATSGSPAPAETRQDEVPDVEGQRPTSDKE